MGMHFGHTHHLWGLDGKCRKCDATRCAATVVQFRRGKPHEIRCKARAFTKAGYCMRCDAKQFQRYQQECAEQGIEPR